MFEFGDDHNHEQQQNGAGNHHHRGRVKHGRNDFALDFFGFLHEFGESVEHHFKHTTQLTGLDHVDVEFVEGFGVLSQTFRKSASTFDGNSQPFDNGLQSFVFFLLSKNPQPPKKRKPSVHKGGQLSGKSGQHLGFDFGIFGGRSKPFRERDLNGTFTTLLGS